MGVFNLSVQDADQYRIMLASAPVSNGAGASGYADGEFLKVTYGDDFFKLVIGTDGAAVRSKTNNRSIQVELSLLQGSATNGFLSGLVNLDLAQPNGAGIGSFVLEDLQGITNIVCSRMWIMKPAEPTLDRTATKRTWTLQGLFDLLVIA
jgi:hypothetical protein